MAPLFQKKSPDDNTVAVLDQIEAIVYEQLKPHGFRRHGRTLHRFVSGDISQVINFQYYDGNFCVNVGIRIPECEARTFTLPVNDKKYYHEYNCQIRTRLGTVARNFRETWFDLHKDPQKIAESICREIKSYVLPVFEVLNSRDQILAHRKDYPQFDTLNRHMILLEESFIYGCRGDLETARARFDTYYQKVLDRYNHDRTKGRLVWLRGGETLTYKDADGIVQTITSKFPHYVRVRQANNQHLQYLDELAKELGLR